jgi:ATP-dependent Clp protease ATP-binding subunit ClpA
MTGKIARTGVEASARRKFTPEFMNRLDKIVTLQRRSATDSNFKQILDISARWRRFK